MQMLQTQESEEVDISAGVLRYECTVCGSKCMRVNYSLRRILEHPGCSAGMEPVWVDKTI